MSGIMNTTGAVSGILGTTVGTPAAGGITEADEWGIRSDHTTTADITADWSRSSNGGLIGTGLGEASGIFSFPSTGIWCITTTMDFSTTSADDYIDIYLKVTTNNSSYATHTMTQIGNSQDNHTVTMSSLVDVTDISNVKFKYYLGSMASTLRGSTSASEAEHRTGFVAIRLGDT